MLKVAWKRIVNRKGIAITTILAMAFIYIIVPLGVITSKESKLSIEETIETIRRGSYDILLRPAASRTVIEKSLGVVEENYIGDSPGGISIEEWEEISSHPSIEIAAPVASLGYFAGNETSVGLPLLDRPARLTWQFKTADGIHTYPISDEHTLTYFEGKPMEYVDYFYNYNKGMNVLGFMGAVMPINHYLVTAIDVESEMALTGVDFTALNTPLDDAPDSIILKDLLQLRGDAPLIPILQRSDLHIPLSLTLKVEELDVSVEEYKERYELELDTPMFGVDLSLADKLEAELQAEPVLHTSTFEIDLSPFQHPFNGNYVEITKNFQVQTAIGGSLKNDTGVYYTASKIDYVLEDPYIKISKTEDSSPPIYKNVVQQGKSYLETYPFSAPFMIWQMGTFTPTEEINELVSSPLGIYSAEKVMTEDGVSLIPTTTPGSFIATPAAGVTTIEAAEIIKGDKPIDAIRIRVAGIESYDKIAQKKIESLATELLNKGYEIDIVAGSSFKTEVMDVEDIGIVLAPWTTLGIAQSLTTNWNFISIVSTGLFVLFGLSWLSSRLIYERNLLSNENEILHKLGWEQSRIQKKNSVEQAVLLIIALLISASILLFSTLMDYSYIFITLLIWIGSMILVWIVFSTNSKVNMREIAYNKKFSFMYYRSFLLPVMVVLVISFMLISIQLTFILDYYIESKVTTLGAFTIESSFYLFLLVLASTLLLTIFSVSEAFNAIIHARRKEFQMYHVIGWSEQMIRKHFTKEVFLWAGLALFIGFMLSSIILISISLQATLIIVCTIASLFLLSIPIYAIILVKKFI